MSDGCDATAAERWTSPASPSAVPRTDSCCSAVCRLTHSASAAASVSSRLGSVIEVGGSSAVSSVGTTPVTHALRRITAWMRSKKKPSSLKRAASAESTRCPTSAE